MEKELLSDSRNAVQSRAGRGKLSCSCKFAAYSLQFVVHLGINRTRWKLLLVRFVAQGMEIQIGISIGIGYSWGLIEEYAEL